MAASPVIPEPVSAVRESAKESRGPSDAATVRHLLGIKARLTWATLTRSPAVIVGVVLGALWGLTMMLILGFMLVSVPNILPPEGVLATAVLTGAAGTLLWWVFSIVSGRADATLHASQFALFPLSRTGIAWGQVLGALVGIAGPVTAIGLVLHASMWRDQPAAVITALLLVPVGWLLMVLGNRCFTALAERLAAKRRVGEAITLLFLVLLMLAGPLITGVMAGVGSLGESLYSVAAVLAWSPVGALWAIPSDVAAGSWLMAAGRVGVVVLTGAALAALWNRALRTSLEQVTGSAATGSARQIHGAGLLDRVPARPWATVAARSLIYWVKDPRYSGSLVVIPVMFLLFWITSRDGMGMLLFAGPFVGFLMAYAISADVAYDHKGFALHILTGLRGWEDRLGRVIGMLLPGVPLTTLALVLSAMFGGAWHLLPALTGVGVLALLGGAGISSVISARYTYPVPLPGQSPFKTPQGFTVLNILAQMVALLVMALFTVPAAVFLILQVVTGSPWWGWVGLAVGAIVGPAVCAGGIWLGGKWLDARAPELLSTVSSYR